MGKSSAARTPLTSTAKGLWLSLKIIGLALMLLSVQSAAWPRPKPPRTSVVVGAEPTTREIPVRQFSLPHRLAGYFYIPDPM